MALWSELPNDLLYLIGKKLDIVVDRCRFCSVCQSWRSSLPPFAQPPWLMLSEFQLELLESSENTKSEKEKGKEKVVFNPPPPRGFVGIGGGGEQQQMVYEIELPEAHQMRCVGSTGTWLITVDLYQNINLLNPFSRVQFNLPPLSTFEYGFEERSDSDEELEPEIYRDCLIHKAILSSTPSILSPEFSSTSSSNKDCIAMAIHHHHHRLAFARPGDAAWTTIETPDHHYVDDIIFFKEQFYAVTIRGIVMVCDFADGLHAPKASVLTERLPQPAKTCEQKYLVELRGDLLLVINYLLDLDDEKEKKEKFPAYKTEKFEIYRLDFTNKKWEEVNSLDEYCLFLGFNTSVSLPAVKYFRLRKNCIYFTDDYMNGYRGEEIPGGRDMGVFDLEDKSIQPHYKGVSTCYYSPPLWIIPNPPLKCI